MFSEYVLSILKFLLFLYTTQTLSRISRILGVVAWYRPFVYARVVANRCAYSCAVAANMFAGTIDSL